MGRQIGLYAPVHIAQYDHPKTVAAAAVLAGAGVPEEYSRILVVTAVNRLMCWALADGETGSVAGLTPPRFAAEAWPEGLCSKRRAFRSAVVLGGLLRKALHAVPPGFAQGYLEGSGATERLHDFAAYVGKVLGDRLRMRAKRGGGRGGADGGPPPDRDGPGDVSPNNGRPVARQSRDSRTTDRATGRATGRRVDQTETREAPPTAPPGGGAAAAAGLCAEVRMALRWRGSEAPIAATVEDLAAAGVGPDDVRAALARDAAALVGLRPFDLRDRLLAKRRPAAPRGADGTAPWFRPAPSYATAPEVPCPVCLAEGPSPRHPHERLYASWWPARTPGVPSHQVLDGLPQPMCSAHADDWRVSRRSTRAVRVEHQPA